MVREQPIDLVRQRVEVGEVHQPNRTTADLVLIGRTDAAARGADRRDCIGGFAQRIEFAMQRQNQRDVFRDAQIVGADGNALPPQLLDLIEEGLRIEHHAVADHGKLRGSQHARRQQRKLVGLAVDDEGVAGIVAALEAHDDVGLLRQPVDDLALPFVAPLGADDDNICHSLHCPLKRSTYEHDRSRKPAHGRPPVRAQAIPNHAPGRNHGRGRSHARQFHRIKEARHLSKLEGGLLTLQIGIQALDIP